MIRILTLVADVILVVFIVREVWRFAAAYRTLKQSIAAGDGEARQRLYRRVLRFEWMSAWLALTGLRFDLNALRPAALGLGELPIARALATSSDAGRGAWVGIALGLVLGTLAFVVMRWRARRDGGTPARSRVPMWLRRWLPDFGPILPVTARERWMWLAVSISAGVCEEIVFRGWLLSVLHDPIGLGGTALVLCAAAGFGLAHAYQGPVGMLLTGLAAVLFIGLYVASGSLLLPILLHVVVDARFALLPGPAAGADDAGKPIVLPGLRAV
jgi:membrane protease YdiL (CAAX protease family)